MLNIYLSGPIAGLTYAGSTTWREYAAGRLYPHQTYSPMRGKAYLAEHGVLDNKPYNQHPMSTGKGIATRDRWDTMGCDIMLCNLVGAKTVSIGSMIECGWADAERNPIVLAMEPGNIHEHAILNEIAGFIVPTLDEAIHMILAMA
jgi:hypothetical protein